MTIKPDEIYFRFAEESDIPEILVLLRSGLGENVIPKTETYWRWKHIENPFGHSIVLLALQNRHIVGIRTFMRWRWKVGSQYLEAVRGVDTVIRPEFQGQGYFGKLTQHLLEYCHKMGYHFLFSTPNAKSKKAYKRLKWKRVGDLPINIKLVHPLCVIQNLVLNGKKPEINLQGSESVVNYLSHPDFSSLLSKNDALCRNDIRTAHSMETLRWRYATVPVSKYFAVGIEDGGSLKGVCFFRFKETRAGREMRITDLFLEKWQYLENIKGKLHEIIKGNDIDYVTSGSFDKISILEGALTFKRKKIGPAVMGQNIVLQDLNAFNNFSNWKPSLGDLELF